MSEHLSKVTVPTTTILFHYEVGGTHSKSPTYSPRNSTPCYHHECSIRSRNKNRKNAGGEGGGLYVVLGSVDLGMVVGEKSHSPVRPRNKPTIADLAPYFNQGKGHLRICDAGYPTTSARLPACKAPLVSHCKHD